MEPFTLDDLARMSEEEAVRSRFDAANLKRLRILVTIYAGVAFVQVFPAADAGSLRGLAATGANFLVCLALWAALRRLLGKPSRLRNRLRFADPLAALVGRRPQETVLTFLTLQYLFLGAFYWDSNGLAPFLITLVFATLFFRLTALEALLLHGLYFLLPLLAVLLGVSLGSDGGGSTSLLVAVGVNDACAAGAGLLLSRRRRREILGQWQQARERSREQLRMRQELDAAREIQLSMLPLESPRLDWLDVASLSLPATEVGGDYYDFFELGGGRLAVVAGDVAGHGVASGLMLAGLRSGLTLLAEDMERPVEVMARLDRLVKQTSRRRTLVTLAILLLDGSRDWATLANAGHPPLLRRTAAGEVEEVALESLPLGVALEGGFAGREVPFERGDVLLLYSDGLYELPGGDGEAYGIERLHRSLAGVPADVGAQGIRDALLADLWAFKGEAPQQDDITFVVLKRRG
jgi:serine phosphatase RsbU (regulator of sigma subunit)